MSEIIYCEFGTHTRFSEEIAAVFLRVTKSPPLEADWTSHVIDESLGECLSVDGETWRWTGEILIDPNSRRVWNAEPTKHVHDALHGTIHELIAATHKPPTTKVLSDAFDVALANINH